MGLVPSSESLALTSELSAVSLHDCETATSPYFSGLFNMADNVGLTTPRGSGTSGYVQKNRSLIRPRDKVAPYPKDWDSARHRPRQPDAEILEHEAKREVEVKVLELRDKLEDEGYPNRRHLISSAGLLTTAVSTKMRLTTSAKPCEEN